MGQNISILKFRVPAKRRVMSSLMVLRRLPSLTACDIMFPFCLPKQCPNAINCVPKVSPLAPLPVMAACVCVCLCVFVENRKGVSDLALFWSLRALDAHGRISESSSQAPRPLQVPQLAQLSQAPRP